MKRAWCPLASKGNHTNVNVVVLVVDLGLAFLFSGLDVGLTLGLGFHLVSGLGRALGLTLCLAF